MQQKMQGEREAVYGVPTCVGHALVQIRLQELLGLVVVAPLGLEKHLHHLGWYYVQFRKNRLH